MQPLLSDLCSICHKTVPKYRCPACSTRTCSLQCVQRHKSWGCSGKRDPTAYVKKSQLASASGVDHDYNFISGIERFRDRGDELLQGKPIHDAEGRSAKLNSPAYRSRLKLTGVTVQYAPLGMTRQKTNQTHLTKSKRILWTVEWIHTDGTITTAPILDDEPLCKGYSIVNQKRVGVPRRKRKRDDEPVGSRQDIATATGEQPSEKAASESSTLKRDHEDEAGTQPLTAHEGMSVELDAIPIAAMRASSGTDAAHEDDVNHNSKVIAVQDDSDARQQSAVDIIGSPDDLGFFYYLVKPRTSGVAKVLIPLSPVRPLLQTLNNQVVLEYPTIQVLRNGPDSLPEGYVSEETYLANSEKAASELRQLVQEDGEMNDKARLPEAESSSSQTEVIPNADALMATLERDGLITTPTS